MITYLDLVLLVKSSSCGFPVPDRPHDNGPARVYTSTTTNVSEHVGGQQQYCDCEQDANDDASLVCCSHMSSQRSVIDLSSCNP
jgi:hypothetical protein